MYEVINWNLKHRWSKVVENKNTHVSKHDNIKNKKNFDRRILGKNMKLRIQIRVHQNKLQETYEFITH